MQLLVSSPWWFILLCFLTGFVYAYLLYRSKWNSVSHKLMALLRFLSVSLLAFFLMGPVLVQLLSEIQKPKVLMVIDNSESIKAGKQSAFYSGDFIKQWREFKEQLGDDYEVEFLNIGGKVELSDTVKFDQKKTNISNLFDYVNNTYARQNIGAVVLASDGIYNRGNNPLYKSLSRHTPLYTVGLGDTSIKMDLMIREANHNAIAYLNNRFPVEINLSAFECAGRNTVLNLVSEGKTLFSQNVSIDNKDFFKTIQVELDADKPGTKHIVASVTTISGEFTSINNRKDIFIDIIDGREKILIINNGPHPDIGAIKEAIASNQNYEVESIAAGAVKMSKLNDYSLLILHQLPARNQNSTELIKQIRNLKIPIWCIVGTQTAIEQLSSVSPGARIDRNQGRFNESQANVNDKFSAFTLQEETVRTLSELPPLKVPFGNYSGNAGFEVLAFQKIGQVNTQNPLWAFTNQNGEKTAYTFGEGFWRWRMFDFLKNESHLASNELVSKTIQYLAVKEDKRKFRVYPVKKIYDEDESVRFVAEIYNASYEPINTADVKLSLTNSANKVFNYNFSRNGKSYVLDLGLLPPGSYNYSASTDGISEKITGKLIITPLQTEMVNTRADFGLLRDVAKNNQGKFYFADDLKTLLDEIKNNDSITSVSYHQKKPDELINLKWIFALLVVLLSAEWLIRKYEGAL